MKLALAFALLASPTLSAAATHLRGLDAPGSATIQVVVPGALREMSPAEAKELKDILAASYKDAYGVTDDVRFTTTGVNWQCRRCRQDDDAASAAAATTTDALETEDDSLRVTLGWQCRRCRQDDDSANAAPALYLGDDSLALRSAWEKSFCAKLSGTGAANFVNARACSIVVEGSGSGGGGNGAIAQL